MDEVPALPTCWSLTPLRELVDPARPITYGVVQPGERQTSGVPIIRGKDYSSGTVDLTDLYLVHPSIAAAYRRSTVKQGDLLISIVGYVGQTAIVPPGLDGANLTQTTARVAVKPPHSNRFLLQQSKSHHFAAEVRRFMKGSAQPGLNLTDVERIRIVVPPPIEQRRIAEILDTVDAAIRSTEQLIAKLDLMKRGLLHDLLTRGIDSNGVLRDPVRHPEQFEHGPAGNTPKVWSLCHLGECTETFAGGTPSRSVPGLYGGSIPWVKSGELNQPVVTQTEECITQRALTTSSVRMVPSGVPIVAMYGATAGVVSWLAITATTNQAVLAVLPLNSSVKPRWLYWELSRATARLLRAIQGSGQPNLSKAIIDDTMIALPNPDEQDRIANIADGLAHRLDQQQAALAKLRHLKRGLMEDLLTGRVRVDGDEDAA